MLSIMKVMAIYAKKTQYFTWLLLLFSTLATNRTALEYFSHVKKKETTYLGLSHTDTCMLLNVC